MLRKVLLFLLAACTMGPTAQAKVRLVATVPDLAAIAAAVAGDRAAVVALALATQDPHFVDARPHLMLQLNRADLLLLAGLDLEIGWLPALILGARNPKIRNGEPGYLDGSTLVEVKGAATGRTDRSMGDVHAAGNPHYWYDPENAARLARGIAARLARIDPAQASHYQRNAASFAAAVRQAGQRWRKQFAPYRNTAVVGYHRSLIYLTDALGLRIAAELEPKPGIAPTPAHVVKVIRIVRQEQVPIVLREVFYPSRLAEVVAAKTGATLISVPGGPRLSKGETFLRRMERTVGQIFAALRQHRKTELVR